MALDLFEPKSGLESWVRLLKKPATKRPTAIVASPGLRSVGWVAVKQLIEQLKPELFAELYSPYFPVVYDTKPSYASHPSYPGRLGVKVSQGVMSLPKVDFYWSSSPELLITCGYHANFKGQYEVALKVLQLYLELKVKRVVVLAAYAREGKDVCSAANTPELLEELRTFKIEPGYEGPFLGFSGLVFGFAGLRGIEALCLFGRTSANLDEPELPDPSAARALLEKLSQILDVNIDVSKLVERKVERREAMYG